MDRLSIFVKAFKSGDFKKFELFYDLVSPAIFFTIKKYIKDAMNIEDIMQEVMLKFINNIHNVDPKKNIKSYLTTIARNKSIDLLRSKKNLEYDDNHIYQLEIDYDYENKYIWLLDTLDKKKREIVYLRIIEELKFKDIAVIVEEPLNTVLWRYREAMKKLKKELKNNET